MKKTLIIISTTLLLIILAGIYKFNYLSSLEGYDVDGNKIQNENDAKYITIFEENNIPVNPTIVEKIALSYPDIEGIDCVGNKNAKDIACVLIDQINFKGLTKVIIFQINDNLKISNQKDFLQKPGESVNFVCGDSCYPSDFWFKGDGIFKYKGHEMISPDKIYSIKY